MGLTARITCRYKYMSGRRRKRKYEVEYREFNSYNEYREYMRKKIMRGSYRYCRVSFVKND